MIVEYSIQSTAPVYVVQKISNNTQSWLNTYAAPKWVELRSEATKFMNVANAVHALIDNTDLDLVIDFVVLTEQPIRARSVTVSDQ